MSIRVDLSKENMDLVMNKVRSVGCNPSEAVNIIISEYSKIIEAESKNNRNIERKSTKGG